MCQKSASGQCGYERDYPSRWAALVPIAEKIGGAPQTLHEWVKKAEVDSGRRAGVPSDVAAQMKALERENRELRQANEILHKASAYFAQAEGVDLRLLPSMLRIAGALAGYALFKR